LCFLGQFLAVSNKSDNISVYDVNTLKQIKKAKFNYEVNQFQWSANSDFLLAATSSYSDVGNVDVVQFTDSHDLSLIETFTGHASTSYALELDSNRQRMAIGACDYSMSLWDLEDMICQHTIPFE